MPLFIRRPMAAGTPPPWPAIWTTQNLIACAVRVKYTYSIRTKKKKKKRGELDRDDHSRAPPFDCLLSFLDRAEYSLPLSARVSHSFLNTKTKNLN